MNPGSPADWQLPPGVNRALWDYLNNPEIARTYDASLAGSPMFSADQQFAERHFVRPGRLIDLGCGTGRLFIPFARRGFQVLGVDSSAQMLRVARERAAAAGVEVALLRANLVELNCLADQSFDYAACLFSTLGMVNGWPERRRVLEHVHRLLRPGGKFILHVHNRWFNFWDPAGRRWLLKDLPRSLFRRRGAGDRVMPAHQGIAGLTLHLFTRRETVGFLGEVGFEVREVQPLGLTTHGLLPKPWWFGWLRAYGYLVLAKRE